MADNGHNPVANSKDGNLLPELNRPLSEVHQDRRVSKAVRSPLVVLVTFRAADAVVVEDKDVEALLKGVILEVAGD